MNDPRRGPRPRAIHRTPPHAVLQTQVATCDSCIHLRPFELQPNLFSCPVFNIRLAKRDVREFGCTFHEGPA